MKLSRAKKIHYNPNDDKPLCCTNHGHQVTLTKDEERVTCKICLFHLGLYEPKKYDPSAIQKKNAETRLALQRLAKVRLQRMVTMMEHNAGQQLTMF